MAIALPSLLSPSQTLSLHPLPALLRLCVLLAPAACCKADGDVPAAATAGASAAVVSPAARFPGVPCEVAQSTAHAAQCEAGTRLHTSGHVHDETSQTRQQRGCPEVDRILKGFGARYGNVGAQATLGPFTQHPPAGTPDCNWQARIPGCSDDALQLRVYSLYAATMRALSGVHLQQMCTSACL